ncbi:MAG TPA: DUF808 domain-containing protein, partial [Actinomycetales bacterium]|nr:DUF808 domain-containing protein [Actinomycetales bacterium]
LLHRLTEPVAAAAGGFAAWVVDTIVSALVGFLVGSVLVGIAHVLPIGRKTPHGAEDAAPVTR